MSIYSGRRAAPDSHPAQPDPRLQAIIEKLKNGAWLYQDECLAVVDALEGRTMIPPKPTAKSTQVILREGPPTEYTRDSQPGVQAVSDAEVEAAAVAVNAVKSASGKWSDVFAHKIARAALEAAAKTRADE